LLTEGFDEPSIQCIVLARKTTSRSLYEQMVGRGVRLHESKRKLKVVQLVPVPPPQPIPVKQQLQEAWDVLKKVILVSVLICAVAWIWKTCSEVVEMSSFTGSKVNIEQPKLKQRSQLSVATVCKLRNGPSTSTKTVGFINPADHLIVLERARAQDRVWTKVQANDKVGWCGCQLEMRQ
jgi:hypothetical protein